MEKWHDSAGLAALCISLAALFGIAFWMRHRGAPQQDLSRHSDHARRFQPWPMRFLLGMAAWILLVIAGTEVWYRAHEHSRSSALNWTIRWPAEKTGFRDESIPDSARGILKYTEGQRASWSDETGASWSMFFFRWAPARIASVLARPHQPDVCLPAAGCHLEADNGVRVYDVGGLRIPFHSYLFTDAGRPLHVWYCLWDNDSRATLKIAGPERSISDRLNAVRRARRNLSEQALEVAMSGTDNPADAESKFEALLSSIIIEDNGVAGPR